MIGQRLIRALVCAVGIAAVFYLSIFAIKALSMFGGIDSARTHVEAIVENGSIGECSTQGATVPRDTFTACLKGATILASVMEMADDPIFDQYSFTLRCDSGGIAMDMEIVTDRGGGKPWCAYAVTSGATFPQLSEFQNIVPQRYPYAQRLFFHMFATFLPRN